MPFHDVINTAISTNPTKKTGVVAGAMLNGRYSYNLADPLQGGSGVPSNLQIDTSGIVVRYDNRFDDRTYYST